MHPSRRQLLHMGGVAGSAAVLGGCATATSAERYPRQETLVVLNKNVQAIRSYNPFSTASHPWPTCVPIYEQLLRLDVLSGTVIRPWLAAGWRFSDGGRRLTFTIRDDVRFSNGMLMTAEDVKYSLELPLKHPSLDSAGVGHTGVHRVGEDKVAITFDEPSYQRLSACTGVHIVPKAIWERQDPLHWTNPEPVGTGPFVLDSFTAQETTLRRRRHYWGKLPAMRYLTFRSASEETAKFMLVAGDLDLATIAWTGAEEHYVSRDPAHYIYNPQPSGVSDGVLFNHTKEPWNDVHVRRAISMALDRSIVARVVNDGHQPMPVTNLPENVYGHWVAPQYRGKVQPLDVAGAKAELERGGWTVQGGKLSKEGRSHRISLTFNGDYPGLHIETSVIAAQLRRNLGIELHRKGVPTTSYYDSISSGKFDVAYWFCGSSGGMYQSYASLLDPAKYTPIGEEAAANMGRWRNDEAKRLLAQMRQTNDQRQLLKYSHQLQRIVVEEVPFIPVVGQQHWLAVNATYWTNWPNNRTSPMLATDATDLGPDMALTLARLRKTQ